MATYDGRQVPMVDASAVLTSMLTPAVLISACGSLVISTSNRLSRVVDRVRQLAAEAERYRGSDTEEPRKALVRDQFDLLARRAILLRESLTRLYVAVALLVVTSLAIAVAAMAQGSRYDWIPISLGLVGAGALLHAVIILVREARLAVDSNLREIAFARGRTGT